MEGYNRVFSPCAAEIFHRDSINSLRAAFSFEEMSRATADQFGSAVHSHRARLLPLYQAHWVPPMDPVCGLPAFFEISGHHRKVFKSLQCSFPKVPLAPVQNIFSPDTAATLPRFVEQMARRFHTTKQVNIQTGELGVPLAVRASAKRGGSWFYRGTP